MKRLRSNFSRLPKLSIWLLILFLGLFAGACSAIESLFGPKPVILLAPETSSTVTPESLDQAREVLQRRLNGMLGKAGVTIEDGNLRVELASQENLSTTIQLATGIGELVFFDSEEAFAPGTSVPKDAEIILTGDDIAQVEVESLEQTRDFYVAINFTAEGAQKMAAYTRDNIGRYLVIAFDGRVISAPVIQSAISDGKVSITGNFDHKSARSLAAQLKSGRLPFKLVVVAIE